MRRAIFFAVALAACGPDEVTVTASSPDAGASANGNPSAGGCMRDADCAYILCGHGRPYCQPVPLNAEDMRRWCSCRGDR